MYGNKFDISDILESAEHIVDLQTRIEMWKDLLDMSELPPEMGLEIIHEMHGEIIKKHIGDKYPKPPPKPKRKPAEKKKIQME